jgi:hypothetical protein
MPDYRYCKVYVASNESYTHDWFTCHWYFPFIIHEGWYDNCLIVHISKDEGRGSSASCSRDNTAWRTYVHRPYIWERLFGITWEMKVERACNRAERRLKRQTEKEETVSERWSRLKNEKYAVEAAFKNQSNLDLMKREGRKLKQSWLARIYSK